VTEQQPNISSALGLEQLCEQAPVARRVPAIVRLYQIDARCRIKLRGVFELFGPVVVDAWRQSAGMEALYARGVWPVLTHYDLELGSQPIAPGHTSELTAALCLGRAPDRALVLATEMSVTAYPGSGARESMLSKQSDVPIVVSKVRSMASLIQPFKPDELVLRSIPDELAHLAVRESLPPPSIDELSSLGPDFEVAGSTLEHGFVWGMHQSDATQLIWNSEYLFAAEDHLVGALRAADLPLSDFRASRVQVVYKRPFLPGQQCVLRGSVFARKRDRAVVGLLGFHPVDASGTAADLPAVFVRVTGSL
jgi:hypothetical protein